jgi:hypothetical protein
MPVTLSLASSAVLLLLLWRAWRNACASDVAATYGPEAAGEELEWCPKEFVAALFSEHDHSFVKKFGSRGLQTLFLQERTLVAGAWVRSVARSVQKIMREHAEISRRASDLDVGTEVGIYLRYLSLQTSCLFLLAAISAAGPIKVRGLATYVYGLSEQLSYAHWAFKSGIEAQKSATAPLS